MANNDIDTRINVLMNTDPAIKEAEKAGPKIEKALTIKSDDPKIQELQKQLSASNSEAQGLRNTIKDIAIDTKELTLNDKDRHQYSNLYGERERKITELKEAQLTLSKQQQRLEARRRVDPYDSTKWNINALESVTNAQKAVDLLNQSLAKTTAEMDSLVSKYTTVTADFDKARPQIDAYTQAMSKSAEVADEIISRNEFLANSVQAVAAAEASSMEEVEQAKKATEEYGEARQAVGDIKINDSGWVQQTTADTSQAAENMKEVEEASRGMAEGLGESSAQGENDISRLLKRIGELEGKIEGIETGKIFATPKEYSKLNAELRAAKSLFHDYKYGVNSIGESSERSKNKIGLFSRVIKSAGASLRTTLKDMGAFKTNINSVANSIKSRLNGAIKSLRTHLNHLRKSLKHGLTNITKYVLGFRSLFFLVRRLRKGIKEGMENLAQYNDHLSKGVKSHNLFNDAMNGLNTSLLYLKNAWAAAFAPIVIKVMPILVGFIDYLAAAGNAVAKFIAELTGQDTAYNAVKVQAQDYADSLDSSSKSADKATKSAKKLQQQLASYDKLDVIKSKDDDDSSPSGSGGGGSSPYTPKVQDMFKTVLADTDGLADRIKKAFDENNFYGLGHDAAQAVKDGLDSIPWDNIQTKVGNAASSLGQFVNGFLGNTGLWQSAGSTIGNAINTVTTAIDKFLDPIDSVLIGYNASEGLRKFLTTTDWEHLGSTIKKFFDKVTSGLQSFIDNFPSEETTQAILDFFKGLDLPSMIPTTIKLAVTGVVTAITVASGVIQGAADQISDDLLIQVQDNNFDFTKDGKPVTMQLEPKADWTKNPLLAYIDSTMTRNGEFWVQMFVGGDLDKTVEFADNWERAWHAIEAIAGLVGTTGAVISLPLTGGVDPAGWLALQGAIDGIKKVIADNPELVGKVKSFKEAVDGVAEIFGKNIVTGGLYSGIQLLVSYFKDPELKKSVDNNPIIKALQGIAKIFGANVATGGLYSAVQWLVGLAKDGKFGDNIKKFVTDPIGTIKTNFNFENVRKNVQEKWNTIKGYFVGENSFLYKIRTKITETKKHINDKFNFENVRKSVKDKWDKIKGYFVGDESILTKIKKRFEDIKFKNPFEIITDAVNAAKKAITGYDKQAAKTGWASTTKVHVKGLAEQLEDAFEGIVKALPTPIKGALKKIQDFINGIIKGVNDLTSKLNGIKISGVNPFTGKAYSYGFNIPKINEIKIPGLAQGAVIPPNKEFMAVLGDQKQGTNIETPLDTMVEAFEKALDSRGGTNHEPIVLQLDGRVVAKTVWDEEAKKYKQTGFGLAY